MTTCLPDVNVWLALTISAHHHHDRSVTWFNGVTEPESVLFCRTTQQAFLRLLSNAAVLGAYGSPPLTNVEALAVYDALVADERVGAQDREPAGAEERWRDYASRDSASPKLWTDAWLAAFAVTGGHRLVSTDAGFRQFAGLDLELLAA